METVADLARRGLGRQSLLEELWSAWVGALFALGMSGHLAEAAAGAEAGIAHARRRGAPRDLRSHVVGGGVDGVVLGRAQRRCCPRRAGP